MAMDSTHVFSMSENVTAATLWHNAEDEYLPQLNLSLIFPLDNMQPAFFRMVSWSIRDVSIIPATVREAGISGAVVVASKGFLSAKNA